jgi:hypothetical protein
MGLNSPRPQKELNLLRADMTSMSGYYGSSELSFSTQILNFKQTGSYNILSVPTEKYFLINSAEVITLNISGAASAPQIWFGENSDIGSFYSGIQITSNSMMSRHVINNPTFAISGGQILCGTIVSGSTAGVHSGLLAFRGYLISI